MKIKDIEVYIDLLIEDYSQRYRQSTFTVERASLEGSLVSLRKLQEFMILNKKKR
jgi:hypothetical protein